MKIVSQDWVAIEKRSTRRAEVQSSSSMFTGAMLQTFATTFRTFVATFMTFAATFFIYYYFG